MYVMEDNVIIVYVHVCCTVCIQDHALLYTDIILYTKASVVHVIVYSPKLYVGVRIYNIYRHLANLYNKKL